MTASMPEIILADEERARAKEVVCEVLDIEAEEITPTGSFTHEFGADSMSVVALSASLERAFDIEIEDEKVVQMDDLEGVYAVVGAALAADH